ncbi:MAG TPA: adenylate/guanylate cyclase domain-containing protein [Candidatus Limnocylindria bacterium]|nr:adenylate/guanylate cyclase domain-containing protein [Candidatus Limnocylindria bacterium]
MSSRQDAQPSSRELQAQLDAVREVLRAISESPFDLERVFGIVVERMASLCGANLAAIFIPSREGFYRGVVSFGMSTEGTAYEIEHETPLTQGTIVGRAVLSGEVVQVEDTANDPSYTWEGKETAEYRTLMGVPIRKESRTIGAVGLGRYDVRLFSAEEIDVVRTFADQAAIVIDNVRLLATIESQREELARYLPSTVAALVSSPDGEKLLAGHRREVTTVFCDLRGFTAFAESAEPEEVLDVMRDYHREMGAIIVAHRGTVEHFAGDGMMIFLNDPEPVDDHVAQGVRMAVAMRDRFAGLGDRWRRLGFDLGLGIGVSVGFATLGRIGFEGHLGYAVVGSVANLAARLCAVAEPGQIIISERVYARVDTIASATALGALELKGFRRPVETYSLTGLAGVG